MGKFERTTKIIQLEEEEKLKFSMKTLKVSTKNVGQAPYS